MRKMRLLLAGVVIMVTVFANLFLAPRWDPVWFADAAFTPVDQFSKERSFRLWNEFLGVYLTHELGITHVDCVPQDSAFFESLSGHQELTGLSLTTDCDPIDLQNSLPDAIHPNMVTTTLVGDFLFATDPSADIDGDRAVLVETQGGVFVLIPQDIAAKYGLVDRVKVMP